ncbi:MAG: hypothetical protein HOG03_06015 [Desulfobacula sp.]|jgi:hypothetical protein|uniref:hypothetical protein n=1 Tax=Desulfobacula sp. TaxID=2593537 RepID=UPI001DCE744A|nr:hypothetical protein [Desulfobacula sp.]MBT3485042.1 hypothetical protein [Desulfobacula sp.]MBT3804141.1 hypothetical protein [Desulfobacula sp.]MBT4024997.1 hypothetical protein [Desulfobacula sp.]MBT4198693.1 hypothetical protein [Desulfobacula sp.]
MKELEDFINSWKETQSKTKQAFIQIYEHLKTLEDTSLAFNARPKVSFSLRPRHNSQKNRSLFAMVDVIDDDPDDRWLSVCFYKDMITDPDEKGDLIPEGLLGEDGYCFDMDEYDMDEINYIKNRLSQACENAKM